ncbi:dihydrolipoyllysine-residue acetyltransferase [Halomonas shantousis]
MSEFILPDIGEGIVECELVKWLIQEGDLIEEDQPVVEVMTDKALVEITAPHQGRITQLYYQEGETARVHTPLFAFTPQDASADTSSHDTPRADRPEPGETPAARDETTLDAEVPGRPPASASPDADTPTSDSVPSSDADTGEATEDFLLPDIGEGIVECEVVTWHVAEGEPFEEDQPVVDVMTDKALVEITAPKAGRMTRHHCQAQQHARVHAPLFAFVPRDREASPAPGASAAPSSPEQVNIEPNAAADSVHTTPSTPSARRRIPASPAVRRLVREHGLRLEDIPGSGKHGRVLKEDVLAFRKAPAPAATASERVPPTPATPPEDGVKVEALRGVRAVMAKRMAAAAAAIPHFAYGDEIDVTELLTLRETLKPQAEAQGTRLTLMPLIMKAMALAIQAYPILNSRFESHASEIHYQPHCNIGMAVDSRAGLMVPNIKRVETLSLLEIAAEVERLTQAAREGRVEQKDLQDGTISISNIGALGGTYAAPIINPPEVAIVALGKIQRLPRFSDDGAVVARSIMTITWSGDHRILDGGSMARFCNLWKSYLQAPQTMLLEMR